MKLRGGISATQFFLRSHAALPKAPPSGMAVSLDTRICLPLGYLSWRLDF